MKKISIMLLILVLLFSLALVACHPVKVTVKFVNENDVQTITVKYNNKISDDDLPTDASKTSHRFLGWFDGETKFESGMTFTSNRTFVAKFQKFDLIATYEVIPDEFDDLEGRVDGTIISLQRLLLNYDYSGITVTKSVKSNGNFAIRVEVPHEYDAELILERIGRPASLEFKVENDKNAENFIVGREHLEKAYVTKDAQDNYAIGLKFNEKGTEKFAQLTSDYLNKSIYIFIDGELYTTVIVNSQISNGTAIISTYGGYTYQNAKEFAISLQAAAFGVTLQYAQYEVVL